MKLMSHDTTAVIPALIRQLKWLPTHLNRSLTWDRVTERCEVALTLAAQRLTSQRPMRLSLPNLFASWRRLAALLMLVATAAASAEAIVPDACDGDGAALRVMVSSADFSTEAPLGPLPSHALHLCHCSHTHAGATIAARKSGVALPPAETLARADESCPTGHVVEPPLRPPVT